MPGDCWFDLPPDAGVECGFLLAAADYDNPAAGELKLAVAILRSRNPQGTGAPVVYLGGGPGAHNLQGLTAGLGGRLAWFLEERDIIVLDQRGAGFSQPSLDCPELTEFTLRTLGEILPLTEKLELELAVHRACRDRLIGEGIDLAWFNTAANAADVDRLRAALGYGQWDLYGVSYGARLAQTVMRDFPGGVRRVVLDSGYPLDLDLFGAIPAHAEEAFRLLIDSCAADQVCNGDYPDLGATLVQAFNTLNESPVPVVVTSPTTGEPSEALITGTVLVEALFMALYNSGNVPLLPEVISEAASGNAAGVALLYQANLTLLESISYGMHHSVQCQDEAPFTSEEEISRSIAANPLFRSLLVSEESYAQQDLAVCAAWDVPPSAPIENAAVTGGIPTLVLAGEFDPITPPAAGMAVASNLSRSTFIEFPSVGHGVLASGPCAASIVSAFLAAQEINTACVGELTTPQWARPLSKTTLVTYQGPVTGFKGVVPAGWEEVAPGYFSRGGQADFSQLIAPGFTSATVLLGITARLETAEGLSNLGVAGPGAAGWRLFQGETSGRAVVIAVADFDAGAGLVYILGPPSQRDALVEFVLLPALAAFEPPG